jgi:excisionase family DNA binding protein
MMHKVNQVAEKLNVSESIVYALIDAGRLACHRIGVGRGTIRVSTEDLDAYLASCRVEKGEEPRPAPRPRLKHIKI